MQSVKYKSEIKPEHIGKADWICLASNPNAIPLLEKNLYRVRWDLLSENPNAIPLLEKNLDRVDWDLLSENPNAIHILEKNLNRFIWKNLSANPNVLQIICPIDYEAMKKAIQPLAEELARYINNPRKYPSEEAFLKRQVELGFIEIDDIDIQME